MKKIASILTFLALGAVCALGAGNTVSRTLDIKDFDQLEINWVYDVELTQSSSYSISLEVSEEVLPYVNIRKENAILTLSVNDLPGELTNRRNWNPVAKVKISMPVLKGLRMKEVSKLKVSGKFVTDGLFELKASETAYISAIDINADSIDISCSGATKLTLTGTFKDVALNMSGATKGTLAIQAESFSIHGGEAAKMKIGGKSNSLNINCSGACDLNLGQLAVSEASVKLTGATKCQLSVSDSLGVELSGASSCTYSAGDNLQLNVISISKGASLKKI